VTPNVADGNDNVILCAVQEDHKIRKPLEHAAANFEGPRVVFQRSKTFGGILDALERSRQLEEEFVT